MNHSQPTLASNTGHSRRNRNRRGVAPIAWTVVAWLALLVAWRWTTDVNRPSGPTLFDPVVRSFVDVPGADAPLYVRGRARSDTLLFVGDSRTAAAISLRLFERETGENAAVLWSGFAPFDHLLRGVRELETRRLIVCFTPLSLYAPPMKRMQLLLEKERGVRLTQRIDSRLDDELDVLRRSWLRPIDPAQHTSWTHQDDGIQPGRQVSSYASFLDKSSWGARAAGLVRLRAGLVALLEGGWSIACVRLPTQQAVENIEDENFAPEQWRTLCQDLGLPYLDMFGGGYGTADGSHLLGADAERATLAIAEWARALDWNALARRSKR